MSKTGVMELATDKLELGEKAPTADGWTNMRATCRHRKAEFPSR